MALALAIEIYYSPIMKPRIHVETSVFSYLTARECASLIGASRQLLTRRWWERREDYALFVSEVVIRECKAGDQQAADHRIAAVGDIPLLSLTDEAAHIAKLLISEGIMPAKAARGCSAYCNGSGAQGGFLPTRIPCRRR